MNKPINNYDLFGQVLGQDGLQVFVDNTVALNYNKVQWNKFFAWGTPSYSDTFDAIEADAGVVPMASVIDPDSPKPKRSVTGITLYSGKIPMLGHAYDVTQNQLRQYYNVIARGGSIASEEIQRLLENNLTNLVFGVHGRLNSMAMMAVSSGHIVIDTTNNPDGGVIKDFDMRVPTANKKWAGFDNGVGAAWTDASATPLVDLQDLAFYADDNFIPYSVMYMDKSLWRTFRTHPNVIKDVASFFGNTNYANVKQVTQSDLNVYMSELGLPPVMIIDEKSGVETDGITSGYTSWDSSNVVLATAGQLGEIKSTLPIDMPDPSKRFAYAEGRRVQVIQSFDGSRKVQGFEVEAWGLPVLTAPKKLLILDTSKTTTWT